MKKLQFIKKNYDTYHCVGHLQHLLKQRILLLMPSRGIHNDDLKALILELVHTIRGNNHRVGLEVAEN